MTVSRFRIILYTAVAIVAVIGLADATYLTVQALTGETLSCGGSPDCFRVLGSSYAKVGPIPVAMLERSPISQRSRSPHSQRSAIHARRNSLF